MGRRLADQQKIGRVDLLEIDRQVSAADGVGAIAARVLIASAVGEIDARQSVDQTVRLCDHTVIFTGTATVFLLLVGLWLPYLAWKSARRLGTGALPMSRPRFFVQIIATQVFLFALAWFTARDNGIELWTLPRWPVRSWTATAALLALTLLTLRLRWKARPALQKARLYGMLPHNERELVPYIGVCLAAGIGEEVVYRGVLTMLLTWPMHSYVAGAVVSAAVFGISHSIQGWRAALAIFILSLLVQALVAFSHSLIPGMFMHAVYDFAAGILIPRWYERDALATSTLPAAEPAAGR